MQFCGSFHVRFGFSGCGNSTGNPPGKKFSQDVFAAEAWEHFLQNPLTATHPCDNDTLVENCHHWSKLAMGKNGTLETLLR